MKTKIGKREECYNMCTFPWGVSLDEEARKAGARK